MRLLIMICAVWALAYGKPEMYKEKEDFQFSRSSSDDGSKSGYYGAQRGNMGGNYEKAHNMDSLAQHQMSTLVRQVDGELGEGANTRTGSVFTAGNSRGLYGSGNYDLTNLHGRNFDEGATYDDSHSQSSFSSQNSGYSGSSFASANNARYSANQQRYSGLNSNYRQTGLASQYGQFDNQQAESQYSGARNYEHGSEGASNYRYYSHGGSQAHNYDDSSKIRQIAPMKIYVRPGTRVTIPVAAQTYDASQSSIVNNQNAVNTEADLLSTVGRVNVVKPKHYESSYSYRKEWEKHDSQPVTVTPTENPFPKNSELYEDSQLSQTAGQLSQTAGLRYQSAADSHVRSSGSNSAYISNLNSGYTSGYSANTKSAAANRQQYLSQQQKSAAIAASNVQTLDTINSGVATNLNDLDLENANSRPKSYHSSYSYHKSWERRGDPYVIKPVGGDVSGQESQRLLAATADQNLYSSNAYGNHYGQSKTICDELCHIRKRRSYNTQRENLENLDQQTQSKWDDLESLGQQTQNQWGDIEGQQLQDNWDNLQSLNQHLQSGFEELGQQPQNPLGHLEDLGQQPQNQLGNLEDLGQQTQDKWDNLETFSKHSQAPLGNSEDLNQQTQDRFENLETLNQHPQTGLEDLGQETQSQLDHINDLGQQTQNTWDNLETLNQQPQTSFKELNQQSQNQLGNLEDLDQQTQDKFDNLETLNQHPQSGFEELGQQTQSQLDHVKDLGQQTQNTWDNLEALNQHQTGFEDLSQQTQNQNGKIEDLGQHTQSQLDHLNDLGQQTQNVWDNLEKLDQHDQIGLQDQIPQNSFNTWNKIEDSSNLEDYGRNLEQWATQFGHSGAHSQTNIATIISDSNQQNNWQVYRDIFTPGASSMQDNLFQDIKPVTNNDKNTDSKLSAWDLIDQIIKEKENKNVNFEHHQYFGSSNQKYSNTHYEHNIDQSIGSYTEKSIQTNEPNKDFIVDSKDQTQPKSNKTDIIGNTDIAKKNISIHDIIPVIDIGRGDIGPEDTSAVSVETSGQSNDDKIQIVVPISNNNQNNEELIQEPIVLNVIGLGHQAEITSTSTNKPKDIYHNSYTGNNQIFKEENKKDNEYNALFYGVTPLIGGIEQKDEKAQIYEVQIHKDSEQQNFAQTQLDTEQQVSNTQDDLMDFGQFEQIPSQNVQQELYTPQEIGNFDNDFGRKTENIQTQPPHSNIHENYQRVNINNLEQAPKSNDIVVEHTEPTEKPRFWNSIWNKTKSTKDSIVSWFKN